MSSASANGNNQQQEFVPKVYREFDMAPGRVAIQWACDRLYGNDVEPFPQFMALLKRRLGGPDPLDYCNAYTTTDGKAWHYITMGFSQLYRNRDDEEYNALIRGFDFELTFRLVKQPEETQAPIWPFRVMQDVARAVFNGYRVREGGVFVTDGPVKYDNTTQRHSTLSGYLFVSDSQLQAFVSPATGNTVRFVQMVGVSQTELDHLRTCYTPSNAVRFLHEVVAPIHDNPLLNTDIYRKCSFELDAQKATAKVQKIKAQYETQGSRVPVRDVYM